MARLKGKIEIQGTLDGLSFYKTQDGIIVRRKWGPDKKRMKTDVSFVAARQHGLEFGACTKDAGLMKRALHSFLKNACDNRVISRLNKMMFAISQLDVSEKGQRRVHKGILHEEAKDLLLGFEFNKEALVKEILRAKVEVDATKGMVKLKRLMPKKDIIFPKGAAHVQIKVGMLCMDFENKRFKLQEGEEVRVSKNGVMQNLQMGVPMVAGDKNGIFVLSLVFLKEVKGEKKELGKEFNGCAIVGV